MCPELPGEHLQDPLPHPPTLREGGEGEVVRTDLPQPWGLHQPQRKANRIEWFGTEEVSWWLD